MKEKPSMDLPIHKHGGNGFGSRYDKWTANYADTQTEYRYGMTIFKSCTKCNARKTMEGGTNKNRKFVCKACNEANK